jgi:hypothetical protein
VIDKKIPVEQLVTHRFAPSEIERRIQEGIVVMKDGIVRCQLHRFAADEFLRRGTTDERAPRIDGRTPCPPVGGGGEAQRLPDRAERHIDIPKKRAYHLD